jgi:hypothetical protein
VDPDDVLRYGFPTPESKAWGGLYIDDHIMVHQVDRLFNPRKRRGRKQQRDESLLAESRKHYAGVGLPRSESKGLENSYSFVAGEIRVDSDSGRVGVPLPKLSRLCSLVVAGVESPLFSRTALQQLLGQFPHPFMHRKEMSCVFAKSYLSVYELGESELRPLPALVKEELIMGGLVVGLANANITWPVSCEISATDATPTSGGAARTTTLESVARCLYKVGVHRGE